MKNMSVSYKKATRCRTCNVLYLSRSEAQICEVIHRKHKESDRIKTEPSDVESDEQQDMDTNATTESYEIIERSETPEKVDIEDYPKKSKRGGFRNRTIWDSESSRKLIELVRNDYETVMTGKTYEKQLVWDKITRKMQSEVPGLNEEQIKTKWKNIRFNFIKYIERGEKGRLSPPDHMDLLLSFLKDTSFRRLTSSIIDYDDDNQQKELFEDQHHSVTVTDEVGLDNVYSVLCQEISEPKIHINEFDSDYIPSKRKKRNTSEYLMKDIAKEIRALNERDKDFKNFLKKAVKNIEECEKARELKEIKREKREMAREEREQAREEREKRREERELAREEREKRREERELAREEIKLQSKKPSNC